MSQFDIYENSNPASADLVPYLLDVQQGLHADLETRLVIPLVRGIPQRQRIPRLCPSFVVNAEEVTLSTPEMGAYPVMRLGRRVGSLVDERSEVFAAMDFLLSGF